MKSFLWAAAMLLGGGAVAAYGACMTDTTQSDFQAGTADSVDVVTSPGNVVLVKSFAVDQQNTTVAALGTPFNTTAWAGQTFTSGLSGRLTRVDINLFCQFCPATAPNVVVSVRATAGGLPTGADLASATISGVANSGQAFYAAVFASPATLTAGTQYAIVVRPSTNPSSGSFALSRAGTSLVGDDLYAGGALINSANSGASWTVQTFQSASTADAGFKTYIHGGSAPAGTWTSATRDSNPPAGSLPAWSALSWSATTPTGTALKFQVAASNSSGGPFDFVGPDTTAGTFFTTSGAALSQFNGKRYLRYRAFLSTTDSALTPTLSDATVCFALTSDADLTISNSDGVDETNAGNQITYTITVANTGPSRITGAAVNDAFPPALTCIWSCAVNGSGQCTALGWGNIADSISLDSGSNAVYTAVCAVAPSATGMLENIANVVAPSGVNDPDLNSNTATDSDMVHAMSSVVMALDDGVEFVRQGDVLDYVIELTNDAGPSDAVLNVADMLPGQLASGSWMCSASGSASCSGGNGNALSGSATVPAGGKVDYVFSATVAAGDGTITNNGSATLQFGTNTPSMIGAGDVDTIVVFRSDFEPDAAVAPMPVAETGSSGSLAFGVDAGLAAQLTVMPATIATGKAESGRALFRLQAMRLGKQVYVRGLPGDAGSTRALPPWRAADLRQGRLALQWRPASGGRGGALAVSAGGTGWEAAHGLGERLARLDVALVRGVPWLVRIAP